MSFRMNLLAAVAVLLPAAAGAQEAQPATPPAQPQSTAPGQMGTTPGQEQATPGAASDATPAATGETPSGQTTAANEPAAAKPATKDEVKTGAAVLDPKGNAVGKIESVSAKGVVLDTGKVKVTVPMKSFAHNDKGLVFGMSKAEVEAAAKDQPPQ